MIALGRARHAPLPGRDARDFFEAWLSDGAGGTCWPAAGALCDLLIALGFAARRVAGSMLDGRVVDHGSVKVRVGGGDWLVDPSLLTEVPLPLGPALFVGRDPVFAVEVEPVGTTHVVWADIPPGREALPCRLREDPVSEARCMARYEAARTRGALNHRVYARRNQPRVGTADRDGPGGQRAGGCAVGRSGVVMRRRGGASRATRATLDRGHARPEPR